MTARNLSLETTFALLGFTDYPELQIPLFLMFLIVYIITVVGNLGMMVIIKINPKFHTPMYFFLSHLSFVDFCYSSIVTPKLLENLVMADKSIFYSSCMLQYFLSCTAVVTESFLLAVMAYDRFVAICNPLLYTVVMSQRLCALLVAGSYLWGMFGPLVLLCYALQLNFSGHKLINHFFCEYTALIAVSSSNTHIPLLLLFGFATFNEVSTLLIILTSYVFIFVTVLNIRSASGRRKAFSTCASHLTAITIFHGTILSLYCVPNSKNSRQTVKVASVFYTVVNPVLNPLIYSLRNKDVKDAFRKLIDTKGTWERPQGDSPDSHSEAESGSKGNMEKENCAAVTDSTLLGFSDAPELRVFLFLLFLSTYGATVLGNLGMIALIQVSSRLHTPMYFFLSHLSFVDFCYSMTITPKMLANILNEDRAFSFLEHAVQFYLFCTFVVTEVILLAVMAYDRLVAICDPLLYMATMSRNLCVELVSCCYLNGVMCSVIHFCLALQIPSYRSNVISHCFCDLPLLSLTCPDVTVSQLVLYSVAIFCEIVTIMVILMSCLFILITILRMCSAEAKCKAFSTCASRLAAIIVFHGTILFIYCRPQSGNSMDTDKVATVLCTVVIPMLNPLIYSLRNKDVKEALRKLVSSKIFSQRIFS
ncbi:LOW QUALITY PROTEIN: uncharacterized protein ACBT57_025555 [Dama dama]